MLRKIHECTTPRGGCRRGMCSLRAERKTKDNLRVCQLYSEQRAMRVKRIVNRK